MTERHVRPTTFTTSRLGDFCNEKELTNQVGHGNEVWPLVAAKEAIDNALDACEEADVAPHIGVTVDDDGITVADNGPGIPADTIADMIDYSLRVSSREAYVGPTRGAQGIGLKVVMAMPFVLNGEHGRVDVVARGQRHQIDFAANHIKQEPVVSLKSEPAEDDRSGTILRILWPDSAGSILQDASGQISQMVDDYTVLNPHMTATTNIYGVETRIEATNSGWKKWGPSNPTSPHWYTLEQFERLIGAFVSNDQRHDCGRQVRDFLRSFRGLAGTAKQKVILAATGLDRTSLTALTNGSDFRHEITGKLLEEMKANSKLVKPAALGVIGKSHLEARFAPHCEMYTFKYKKVAELDEDGIPVVVETAFAECPFSHQSTHYGDTNSDFPHRTRRRLIAGVNWSPGIGNPFRQLGGSHGESLDSVFEQQRVSQHQSVMLVVHVACPRVQFLDRGKTSVTLD